MINISFEIGEQRINSEVQIKVLCKAHERPTGRYIISPSKGNQGTTRGKEKIF